MHKLKDVYGNPFTNTAIFSDIYNIDHASTFPWLTQTEARKLDLLYIANHSGEKPLSPMVYNTIYGEYKDTASNWKSDVAGATILMFSDKWSKLFDVLYNAEYDPIQNYKMTEKTIKDINTTEFGKKLVKDINTVEFGKELITDKTTLTHGEEITKSGNETDGQKVIKDKETETPEMEKEIREDVYAYNNQTAASPTPQSKTTESFADGSKTTREHEYEDLRTKTYNDVKEAHEGDDINDHEYKEGGDEKTTHEYEEGGDEKVTHEYEFTREGNIGVTTSQQMIESEWELRKHLFYKEIMSDVDSLLTLKCY